MQLRHLIGGLVALATLLPLGMREAQALPVLTFDVGSPGGSLSYDGSTVLTGSNIVISGLTVAGAPANNGGPITCVLCSLSFVTGSIIAPEGPPTWTFGSSSSSFTLTGTIPSIGITSSTTLVSGVFTSPITVDLTGPFLIFSGAGADTKDPALLAYFGIASDNFKFGTAGIATGVEVTPDTNAFNGTVTGGGVVNQAVPEPATLGLLGVGIVGLGLVLRRRQLGTD